MSQKGLIVIALERIDFGAEAATRSLGCLAAILVAGGAFAQAPPSRRAVVPGTPPFGIGGTPDAPAPAILAQDNDWGFLADPARRPTVFDRLRDVPLGDAAFLSLGVNGYAEYELFQNPGFGTPPNADAYLNTRLNLYAGLTLSPRLRLFAALKHGGRAGSEQGFAASERKDVDLHMALVELGLGELAGAPAQAVLLRVGRQELHYGAGRLVSTREGPNVRQDHEAVVLRAGGRGYTVEAFGAVNVRDRRGAFTNGTDWRAGLRGMYGNVALGGARALDVYYFGDRRRGSRYVAATVDETRHTLGARLFAPRPRGFSYDIEGAVQFGRADPLGDAPRLDIAAWNASAELYYRWPDAALAPALRVSAGVTSGDADASDGTLGTFRAPRPPGRYFGENNILGPGNLAGVSLGGEFSPVSKLTVAPSLLLFRRNRDADGIYAPPGFVVRGAAGERNFLGTEINLSTSYALTPQIRLGSDLVHFDAQDYLSDNRPARKINRVRLYSTFQF